MKAHNRKKSWYLQIVSRTTSLRISVFPKFPRWVSRQLLLSHKSQALFCFGISAQVLIDASESMSELTLVCRGISLVPGVVGREKLLCRYSWGSRTWWWQTMQRERRTQRATALRWFREKFLRKFSSGEFA